MASGQFGSVLRHIRQLIGPRTSDELTDGQLLERFTLRQEESAFEALMQRHGPMVHNLCRNVLHDPHAADDAFQATFMVLARKATSIQKRQSVASWLYGVAYRISLRSKANATRRRLHERQTIPMPATDPIFDVGRQELRSVLNEELQRLPEKYRAPLILCYLEGKSNETAAAELGWPSGSMSKRLARARDLLRERLAGRGVALSLIALTATLAEGTASAAVPVTLMKSTLQAAIVYGVGKASMTGLVSSQAVTLADGLLQTMWVTKLKALTTACLLVVLIGGAGVFAYQSFSALPDADGNGNNQPVTISEDPQAQVLSMDIRGGVLAAEGAEPYLTIRADGTAVFGNPHGDSRRLEMKLTSAELQDLLRFAVRDNDFFRCDSDKIAAALKSEAARKGRPINFRDAPTTTLRIQANGREHEVRCQALTEGLARQFPEVKEVGQLRAIQHRLERLVTLIQAGGPEGVALAVAAANQQLATQFPDAPPFTAADLQSAQQRPDGRIDLVLERRGISEDKDPFSFVYARIERGGGEAKVTVRASLISTVGTTPAEPKQYLDPINVNPPSILTDPSVRYDYDIVYVRTPRSDEARSAWTEIGQPAHLDAGGDLMLLHPDGSEEVLVKGGDGSVADPSVSFDGDWVYYTYFHGLKNLSRQNPYRNHPGADIYKIHVKTKKVVRLTHQEMTPNTGAGRWTIDFRTPEEGKNSLSYGAINLSPCPLPHGRLAFVSNRNAFKPAKHNATSNLQLFVMDDDGSNVECIGHLNLNMVLNPTVLTDGRIVYNTNEAMGLRSRNLWGLHSIHPDGTNWQPIISATLSGEHSPNAYHFQTQLSDGSIVAEEYFHKNNSGFGTYVKLPSRLPEGVAPFGPAFMNDPRNPPLRGGRNDNGNPIIRRLPFSPFGIESLTQFARATDGPADPSIRGDKQSPAVGKVTHPAGAPDNHLLTVWAPGQVNWREGNSPAMDSGIYIIKSGKAIDEPGQMLLIKNDPNYNERWPRALVPYKRIHGIDEPKALPTLRNDGSLSPHLPEGTPYALIGVSSLYKRETYPNGVVPPGTMTATFAGKGDITGGYQGLDPFNTGENGASLNWVNQGAEAGRYGNDDIHAIRILAIEPTTDRRGGAFKYGRLFHSHGKERLRILGEIPVRKFGASGQPIDTDGNPDTSFLARIPADTPFTFQTLDENGMVLNMAQTWHQLRPGEMRVNCGGCHVHSQKPTLFQDTAAAKTDYPLFDLSQDTPLLTTKAGDQSKKKWDTKDESGLRTQKGVKHVEYFRDVKPILDRSCVACHTQKWQKPAGNLVLDDDQTIGIPNSGAVPGTYFRLAADNGDQGPRFGHKPAIGSWRQTNASRYVRMFQSRRSLLTWKIFGKRLDGWSNDDFPTERVPGDPETLELAGKAVPSTPENRSKSHLIYNGAPMPPPEAVAGTYQGPDGGKIKVAPLNDEDRLTIVRWIDLGCPIDLDYDPQSPLERGFGWMLDDQRPTLTLTYPQPGVNGTLSRLVVGMVDSYTGLDMSSFQVVADFPIDGIPAGTNLGSRFKPKSDGVWEFKLTTAIEVLPKGKLTVLVKDRQGNLSRIERTFSVVSGAK
ncbi:MAG: sigma-70 family RNA polymerase sigma factor [Gemmataceae bacterium]|nr:sigma-70 family RNA polymerase sigma factor [Gemmataceae bacterium]